jgi:hypothetical protein
MIATSTRGSLGSEPLVCRIDLDAQYNGISKEASDKQREGGSSVA